MTAPQTQHSPLADFINHGTLPFVGRREEIEAIVRFWQLTAEAHELRSMLLIGEAGVGKSRLLQEVIERIESQGGVVVHARLYPESANAIAPILAQSLWQSSGARQLLKSEPDGSMGGVIAALRRFARLRPTIIILEDVHLLVPETVRDFASLLEAIADEPLAILCAARPVELLARGVLERSLGEEILVDGLTESDMSDLWRVLFHGDVSSKAVGTLSQSTLGNALALRSALRNAIKQGAIAQQSSGYWETDGGFQTVINRSVRSLSEGMTIQFTEEERHSAEQLATLGEIFSREAAGMMKIDIPIDDLIFKGLLVELSMPRPPLPTLPKSAFPVIAFTHSLVHRQLLESIPMAPYDALHRVLASGLPLYSILPFELLERDNDPASLPQTELCGLLRLCLMMARGLDRTSDWKLATTVWGAVDKILRNNAGNLEDLPLLELRAELLYCKLSLMRRDLGAPEYREIADEVVMLTENPTSISLVESRLWGFIAQIWSHTEMSYEHFAPLRDRIVDLATQFPGLRSRDIYISALRDLYQTAHFFSDVDEQRRIEDEYQTIVGSEDTTEAIRSTAQIVLAPYLLSLFETSEELQKRVALYQELKGSAAENGSVFAVSEVEFLLNTGRVDEMLVAMERTIPQLRTWGMMRTYHNQSLMRLWGLTLLGGDLKEIDAELEAIDSQVSNRFHIGYGGYDSLVLAGQLRDELAWTGRIIERYIEEESNVILEWKVMAAVHHGATAEELALLADMPEMEENLGRLVRLLAGTGDAEAARYAAVAILHRPLLRFQQVWSISLALALCDAAEKKVPGILDPIRSHIKQSVDTMLEWLGERRLPVVMDPIIRNHAGYFTDKQLRAWRKKIDEYHRERGAQQKGADADMRVHVSLIGKIEVKSPDQPEPVQPRGSRMRAFLGAMAAAAMMPAPIPREDFFRILSIELDDSKQTRDLINSAIYRLRELIGSEGVNTDGEIPMLNEAHVYVDAIEVHRLLVEAKAATRRRELMLAQRALLRALDMVGSSGAVLFPTLYDSFFEAMREDFESRLRSAVIDVSSMLLREGDAPGAEEILRRAWELMPDDEEVGELYREALKGSGRIAEAELVGLRSAEMRV